MHYVLSFDGWEIASVEIDPIPAGTVIRQMLEFWDGPADPDESDEDLREDWLKRLGLFIMRNDRGPFRTTSGGKEADEGWALLDGQYGITLIAVDPFEFTSEDIEVQQTDRV